LEVLRGVDAGPPEDRELRLVPDVEGEVHAGVLDGVDRGVDEGDPVGAVAVGTRVHGVGRLAGVRAEQIADQQLILHALATDRLGDAAEFRSRLHCMLAFRGSPGPRVAGCARRGSWRGSTVYGDQN